MAWSTCTRLEPSALSAREWLLLQRALAWLCANGCSSSARGLGEACWGTPGHLLFEAFFFLSTQVIEQGLVRGEFDLRSVGCNAGNTCCARGAREGEGAQSTARRTPMAGAPDRLDHGFAFGCMGFWQEMGPSSGSGGRVAACFVHPVSLELWPPERAVKGRGAGAR